MATAKPGDRKAAHRGGTPWLTGLLVGAGLLAAGWWYFGVTIAGYAAAGTGYGAKNACSCRYLAGRDLDSCYADFVPGMEAVFLSEDEEARSVTASVPLVHSETATFREGFGCVLESPDS